MNAKTISAVLLSTGMALASFSAMAFDKDFWVHCSVEDDKRETITCLDVSGLKAKVIWYQGKTSDEYAYKVKEIGYKGKASDEYEYKGMVIHGQNNQKHYLEGLIPSEEGYYHFKSLGRPDHADWPSHLEISDDRPELVPILFYNVDEVSHYITDWIE